MVVVTLAVLTIAHVAFAQIVLPVRMRAFGVNMSNNLTGANGIVEITLDKWSTADERTKLLETVPKGQDALLRALQKAPVKGRIRLPNFPGQDPQNYRLGWNLRYAWHEPLDEGGERIVIATDRYMSFWEVSNQPRTVDYPFLLIQIHLNKEAVGHGGVHADRSTRRALMETRMQRRAATQRITTEKSDARCLDAAMLTERRELIVDGAGKRRGRRAVWSA
jgi:hypothetical protein